MIHENYMKSEIQYPEIKFLWGTVILTGLHIIYRLYAIMTQLISGDRDDQASKAKNIYHLPLDTKSLPIPRAKMLTFRNTS